MTNKCWYAIKQNQPANQPTNPKYVHGPRKSNNFTDRLAKSFKKWNELIDFDDLT